MKNLSSVALKGRAAVRSDKRSDWQTEFRCGQLLQGMAMTESFDSGKLDTKTIAEAVRKTRFLDPVLKKRWLTLLPHMRDEERRELWSILTESEKQLDQLDTQSDVPR